MVMHDPYWTAVADFLRSGKANPVNIVAPREFDELLPGIVPYEFKASRTTSEFEWVVVHKGLMEELGREWLELIVGSHMPVFANEVFVLFARNKDGHRAVNSTHFESFLDKLRSLAARVLPPNAVRNERMTVYLGDHTALTRTVHGHKMYVDTRDLSLSPHLLLDGVWESWVTDVFISQLEPGMHVVDIGANVGYYSLIAANRIGRNGRCYSFEANPEICGLLRANLEINGFRERAEVIQKAVYREETEMEFNLFEKHMGSSSLWADVRSVKDVDNDNVRKITVQTIPLDKFFTSGTRVDFLKIDAEGAEPYILEGMRRLLKENPQLKMILEFNIAQLQRALWLDGAYKRLYQTIADNGFRVFRIEHDSSLREVTADEMLAMPVCDVLVKR